MTQLSDHERLRTRPAVAGRVTREQPSEALVAACLAGEQDAWSKLVNRYSPLVRTVARSHRLSTADCDEVCQLTWLRVYENLAQLRCAASFPAWVTTCARRESVKQLGRAARYVPVGDSSQLDRHGGGPVVDDSGPEGSWIGSELRGEVLAALRELPPRDRALLTLLSADEPVSYDDVSRRLGIARGSVGPLRGRALRRLAALLRSTGPDSAPVPI